MKKSILIFLFVAQTIFSFKVLAAEQFLIKSIHIDGLQRISKDVVLQELHIQVGQTFKDEDATEIIHTLFKTGFFSNINVERKENILVIKLTERSTIGNLTITGIRSKDDVLKILKGLNIAEGRVYDPSAIIKAEQEIEYHYLAKGRYGVKVSSEVTKADLNRVNIILSIYTGDEAKIKKIKIVGNKAFTEKVLLKQLLHTPTNWISWYTKSDRYAKEKLAADLEILQSYYMDRGYVNIQVDSTQVSLSPNKKDVYITINVTEGEQYYLSDINLDGKFVVPKAELQKLVDKALKPGDVFSRKLILEVKENLEAYLGNIGYSKTQARLDSEVDNKNKKIKIGFFVDPKHRVTVRRIEFVGNRLTQDIVLRRGLLQKEGSWVSIGNLKAGKEYMLREGYASEVDIEHKPVFDSEDQIDIKYKIEEQRINQFGGGIAYSAAEKLAFMLSAELRNFLGTGKDINFEFNNSKVSTTYSFGYFDPFFSNSGVGMGYNLFYRKSTLSKTSSVFEYDEKAMGGDIRWSWPVSLYDRFIFALGIEKNNLDINEKATPKEAKAFIDKEGKKFTEYSTTIVWRHNSFDQYLFPTKGLSQTASLKVTLPGSKLKYYKLDYDISWYYPLTGKYIINLSGDVGYQKCYKSSQYFPFFKNFYAGGADTVRGYEEKSLGPRDSKGHPFGGNILTTARASFIFPTPFVESKNTRMSLFLDAGQVYDTNYKKIMNPRLRRSTGGLRYSAGISLTVNIVPLGMPIVMSLGYPLNAKKYDQKDKFTINFGVSM